MRASSKGHLEVMKLLLQSGAESNCQDSNKLTPLLEASVSGNWEISNLLLQNGADIYFPDKGENTPLHIVSQKGYFELTKLFLDNNASLTLKNSYGQTAHDVAKENKHKRISRLIYEKMVESLSLKDCVLCFHPRRGTFVLQPCGHAKTCEKCCLKIVADETKSCPICRGNVTKYQKIFD